MKKLILSLFSLLVVFSAAAQLSIGVTNSFVSSNSAFPPKKQPSAFLKNSLSGRLSYDFPLTKQSPKSETVDAGKKGSISLNLTQLVNSNKIDNTKLKEFATQQAGSSSYSIVWKNNKPPKNSFGTLAGLTFSFPLNGKTTFKLAPKAGLQYGSNYAVDIYKTDAQSQTLKYSFTQKNILPIYEVSTILETHLAKGIHGGVTFGYGSYGFTTGVVIILPATVAKVRLSCPVKGCTRVHSASSGSSY